jgi:hypothetical protein
MSFSLSVSLTSSPCSHCSCRHQRPDAKQQWICMSYKSHQRVRCFSNMQIFLRRDGESTMHRMPRREAESHERKKTKYIFFLESNSLSFFFSPTYTAKPAEFGNGIQMSFSRQGTLLPYIILD